MKYADLSLGTRFKTQSEPDIVFTKTKHRKPSCCSPETNATWTKPNGAEKPVLIEEDEEVTIVEEEELQVAESTAPPKDSKEPIVEKHEGGVTVIKRPVKKPQPKKAKQKPQPPTQGFGGAVVHRPPAEGFGAPGKPKQNAVKRNEPK